MYSTIKTFLLASILFGLSMGLVYGFLFNWERGFSGGIASGLAFGLIMALFANYQANKFTKNRPLLPEEVLIKEGGANHFLNMEAVGGWIYLTDSRFYFKSHNTNFQNHEFIIPHSEIVDVKKSYTFGILPNKLLLTLQNGDIEKFVVSDAKSWVKEIHKII